MDSANVQQTAALLLNATKNAREFYGSDVKVAYHLTRSILQHESNQQGFNLSATQDVLFNEVRFSANTPFRMSKTLFLKHSSLTAVGRQYLHHDCSLSLIGR